jgi:predicted nucleotide-binding protein
VLLSTDHTPGTTGLSSASPIHTDASASPCNASANLHGMEKVPANPRPDLPTTRSWNERGSVLGAIKGTRSRLIEDLTRLTQIIASGVDGDELVSWPDPHTQIAVGNIVGPIYNCGLFYRQGQRIQLSANGKWWLKSRNKDFLIALLHANVRFVGEILSELQAGPLSHPALLVIAQEKYEFGWTTDGPIHNRTKWLEAAGFLNSYSHRVHLSDDGKRFLGRIDVHEPAIVSIEPSDLLPPPGPIADLLARLESEGLNRSRAASAYIPAVKNNAGQIDAMRSIVASCATPTSDHSLTADTARMFDASPATAEKFMRTLMLFGLLKRVSSTEVMGTPAGLAWTETAYPIDLARVVHANVWFFGEILVELDSAGDLRFSEILRRCVNYSAGQYEPLKRAGLTARVALLEGLGLITYVSNHRYRTTELGRAFQGTIATMSRSEVVLQSRSPSSSGSAPREDSALPQHQSERVEGTPVVQLTAGGMTDTEADAKRRKNVMVVFGRNGDARLAMFDFLRSIGLNPIEWSRARSLTREASPYIGTILDTAFNAAQAVVVLFTPDEVVNLRPEHAIGAADPDIGPALQARPNVLLEAGMALGRDPARTVLVKLGRTRDLSDLAGRYFVQMDNSPTKRQELAERLRDAGCDVDTSGSDWLVSGKFKVPEELDFGSEIEIKQAAQKITSSNKADRDWTRSGNFSLRTYKPKNAGFGLFTVLGEARNNGPAIQMASITAIFSDLAGKIIGSATGAVSQIMTDEVKAFTLNSTDDLSAYANSRVQVDSAI